VRILGPNRTKGEHRRLELKTVTTTSPADTPSTRTRSSIGSEFITPGRVAAIVEGPRAVAAFRQIRGRTVPREGTPDPHV